MPSPMPGTITFTADEEKAMRQRQLTDTVMHGAYLGGADKAKTAEKDDAPGFTAPVP